MKKMKKMKKKKKKRKKKKKKKKKRRRKKRKQKKKQKKKKKKKKKEEERRRRRRRRRRGRRGCFTSSKFGFVACLCFFKSNCGFAFSIPSFLFFSFSVEKAFFLLPSLSWLALRSGFFGLSFPSFLGKECVLFTFPPLPFNFFFSFNDETFWLGATDFPLRSLFLRMASDKDFTATNRVSLLLSYMQYSEAKFYPLFSAPS